MADQTRTDDGRAFADSWTRRHQAADRPRDSFTCPRCSRVSFHSTDVREGYCGACHDVTGPRYGVIAERDQHGGPGWTLIDRTRRQTTGGWFVDRIAAERTADVLNEDRD
jgi:ribosomal protein L37E